MKFIPFAVVFECNFLLRDAFFHFYQSCEQYGQLSAHGDDIASIIDIAHPGSAGGG